MNVLRFLVIITGYCFPKATPPEREHAYSAIKSSKRIFFKKTIICRNQKGK